MQEALPEVETLRERLSEEKRKLDDELLKSAGLENQLTRMEEDLNFKMQLLVKELTEVRRWNQLLILQDWAAVVYFAFAHIFSCL